MAWIKCDSNVFVEIESGARVEYSESYNRINFYTKEDWAERERYSASAVVKINSIYQGHKYMVMEKIEEVLRNGGSLMDFDKLRR